MKRRVHDEKGAVLVVVALVMTSLMILSAGGIMLFTLYGTNREMQKAADQAALAGAAALPPVYPNVLLDNLPYPLSFEDISGHVHNLTTSVGLDVPMLNQLVPDPRAVACFYGHESLTGNSAGLTNSFGAAPTGIPSTVCSDNRVHVSMHSNTILSCVGNIVTELTNRLNILGLGALLQPVLNAVLAPVNRLVDGLNQALPAVLSPTMTVNIHSKVNPPMFSMISGNAGVQMNVEATAVRRLKNAVVVPTAAGGQLNLNTVLLQAQGPLFTGPTSVVGQVNTALNGLLTGLGITSANCQNIVANVLQKELADIYNPPGGGGPSARDVVAESIAATQATVAATPGAAGEAFFLIGAGGPQSISGIVSGALGLLGPLAVGLIGPVLGALQIPTLDVALVTFDNLAANNVHATVVDAANARGMFAATLVK